MSPESTGECCQSVSKIGTPSSGEEKRKFISQTAASANEDFRDQLSTADKEGHRRWVYPKKPCGHIYEYRKHLSWLLLAILFIGPFITIDGNPLLMVNIIDRRFSILGQIFWPQDMAIIAVGALLFLTAIFVFTSAFGRLWCGWACPQVLLMEMVFRRFEYLIEGDALAQKTLDKSPWTGSKIFKKCSKHLVFFGFSFVIANTLLTYIIGSESFFRLITDPPREHIKGFLFMLLFTGVFYWIFARFREQACAFICPYGRLQSTLMDENTMIVAYDYKRGRKRPGCPPPHPVTPANADTGDCIDCLQCVAVCPSGIDIRNGTQMECVHCAACIDACNRVMDKVGRPRGLIRYASLNEIEAGKPFRITPRMIAYGAVVLTLASVFITLILTRSNVEATFLRAPGSLFQESSDGQIENLYTVQLVNKTSRDIPVQLKLLGIDGKLSVMGHDGALVVSKDQLAETSVLIELPRKSLHSGTTKLKIGLYSKDKLLETINTVFVGPDPAVKGT